MTRIQVTSSGGGGNLTNADTLDGIHGTDTPVDGQLLTYYGGWRKAPGTWTYASASTITVTTGAASYYSKGDRIRWKQGGAYKYGVIVTVADTLLTIAVNIDYTVANSAITDMYFSHEANPLGYPSWFNYAATIDFDGTDPTTVAVNHIRFNVLGTMCSINIFVDWTNAGTTNTTATITLPITHLNAFACATGFTRDSGGTNRPNLRTYVDTVINLSITSQNIKQIGVMANYQI